jgi:hypothetical protein
MIENVRPVFDLVFSNKASGPTVLSALTNLNPLDSAEAEFLRIFGTTTRKHSNVIPAPSSVIPAKAGIQFEVNFSGNPECWIPDQVRDDKNKFLSIVYIELWFLIVNVRSLLSQMKNNHLYSLFKSSQMVALLITC